MSKLKYKRIAYLVFVVCSFVIFFHGWIYSRKLKATLLHADHKKIKTNIRIWPMPTNCWYSFFNRSSLACKGGSDQLLKCVTEILSTPFKLDQTRMDYLRMIPEACWDNWFNLSSLACKNTSNPIKCAAEILSPPFKSDQNRTNCLRNLIDGRTNVDPNPILTQSNTEQNSEILFIYGNTTGHISKDIYDSFLKVSPFKSIKSFKTCSVVGSSGILLNSSCGKEIDKSEMVFRSNIPPLKPFSKDAGTKSNFSTMNLITVPKKRYSKFKTSKKRKKFISDLNYNEYSGYFWITPFASQATLRSADNFFKTLRELIEKETRLKIIVQNPIHWTKLEYLYQKLSKSTKKMSTGLYLSLWAFTLCEETTLYGFWPFNRITENETSIALPYHYYDRFSFTHSLITHSMDKEFQLLLKLHQNGMVKVHFGKC